MYSSTTATRKVLALDKRIQAIAGGTSASKTISTLLKLISMAQQDRVPTLTSVVSETMPHLKRGAMRDFQNIMQTHMFFEEARWNKTDSIYTFPLIHYEYDDAGNIVDKKLVNETGSRIEFFSTDSPDKVRGPRRDRLYINEANNVPFEAFQQLEVRTKSTIILDWNPTNEFWFYTDVLNNPLLANKIDFITLTYKDNEALDAQIVQSIESRRNNKQWWRVYGEGQLGENEDRIYTGWNIIDTIPHEARLERYGLDFGYSNDPTAIVAIYYYNGGYILDEITYQKGLTNKQIADILINQPKALVMADSAEPKSIDELKLYGINVLPAQKGQGSVNQGIQYVQDQQMSITKKSINGIKEYRNYMWKTDKDGRTMNTPEDMWNHFLDATRYGMDSVKPSKPIKAYKPQDMLQRKYSHV